RGDSGIVEDDVDVVKTFLDEGPEVAIREPPRKNRYDVRVLEVVPVASNDAASLGAGKESSYLQSHLLRRASQWLPNKACRVYYFSDAGKRQQVTQRKATCAATLSVLLSNRHPDDGALTLSIFCITCGAGRGADCAV